MNNKPLSGIDAVVVGIHDASGWEVVHALQEAGSTVAAFTPLYEAAGDLTYDGFSGWCDTGSGERVEAVMEVAKERLTNIRILVNLADEPSDTPLEATSPEAFDRTIQANLTYVMQTTRALADVMRRCGGGSIVNVISSAAVRPGPNQTAYAAAQGGIPAFSRVCVMDLHEWNIRVNCLIADDPAKDPVPFAQAVLFLASDRSQYITGSTISLEEATTFGKAV